MAIAISILDYNVSMRASVTDDENVGGEDYQFTSECPQWRALRQGEPLPLICKVYAEVD